MLRLITGRAGTGKTALVMEEIRGAVERGAGGRWLLVPEQYSHEAERELAEVAGPRLPLYAEVLSFTGLARKVEAELGPGGRSPMDAGGRLLCMALAVDAVYTRLKVYAGARRSPELQAELLRAVDELSAAGLGETEVSEAAELAGGALGKKLADLALIMGAFRAAVGPEHLDSSDRLAQLLERLPESEFGREGHIYVDGFIDFTGVELKILAELLGRGADMTVCLTVDALDGDSEVFELSRRTARRLMREAKDRGVPVRTQTLEGGGRGPADLLAENMLGFGAGSCDAEGKVFLYTADSVSAECELAASRAVELAKSGCRWRDIAVAVRSFEDYRAQLEAAFRYYGAPLFTARQTDISQKPLPALISAAYEIVCGGWEQADVFAYLRTGLAGLSTGECDELENYCFTWSIRGSRWYSEKDWRMHPEGFSGRFDEASEARLGRINELRYRASEPLMSLDRACRSAHTAREQAGALAQLFEDLGLAERLAERADELERSGRLQAAEEYARLWDAAVSALEQCARILADTELDTAAFSRLYLLTLSQYAVGVIPVSLDMVSAGDMDRMRRRHIKHLIILGASDERLPGPAQEGGVFNSDERRALSELGVPLDAGDAELWREFSLIYNCLSLPSETLTLVSPAFASDGSVARPSFIMNRAARLFGLHIVRADSRRFRTQARGPALELAASGEGALGESAREYFARTEPETLVKLKNAAKIPPRQLSGESARALYGDELQLSPSRVEKFAGCRFAYFLNYGLRAKPRRPAQFRAPEAGSFIHYILQHVAEETQGSGGLEGASDDRLDELCDEYSMRYLTEELGGLEGKSARFAYLFARLAESVRRIVQDMAEELRASEFKPLSFELDLSRPGLLPAAELPDGGRLRLGGVVDRVDGWVHGGRLYLRVVDYKTGSKSFSLSDVVHGLNMQMLLYLFALESQGKRLYGQEPVPAGVLYIPARDILLSEDGDLTDEDIAARRREKLRRSGLVLDDPEVLLAMENSEDPVRLPVKWKGGVPTGDSLATAERMGALGRRVEDTLKLLASELRSGSITADPAYKSAQENACLWCEYADACRFTEGEGGDKRRYLPRLSATRVWDMLEGGGTNG